MGSEGVLLLLIAFAVVIGPASLTLTGLALLARLVLAHLVLVAVRLLLLTILWVLLASVILLPVPVLHVVVLRHLGSPLGVRSERPIEDRSCRNCGIASALLRAFDSKS
jgi:hypothetical protein